MRVRKHLAGIGENATTSHFLVTSVAVSVAKGRTNKREARIFRLTRMSSPSAGSTFKTPLIAKYTLSSTLKNRIKYLGSVTTSKFC